MGIRKNPLPEPRERASERMSLRAQPHIKAAIHRAALLSGMDDSAFTLSAAYRSALATIAAHEQTALSPADHQAFFDALDTPSAPTDALRAAFARHAATVVSR